MRRAGPVLAVVLGIVVIWYLAAIWLNAPWIYDQAQRSGNVPDTWAVVQGTMNQSRPVLPTPHQVLMDLKASTLDMAVTSKRSLVYHAGITLGATLTGFLTGIVLGLAMAIAVTHSRTAELSVTPWAIISQTIPIVALAPMIVVLAGSAGVEGRLVPKTVISAYLSYFPVFVSMVKGLRSPDAMQLDLLRTYGASRVQTFWKLRLPASMPYFFASMKIAMAASLVGAIVGELPTGAVTGLGARMLIGSQFGQPLTMWSALMASAILAAVLILVVGGIERVLARRMGVRP